VVCVLKASGYLARSLTVAAFAIKLKSESLPRSWCCVTQTMARLAMRTCFFSGLPRSGSLASRYGLRLSEEGSDVSIKRRLISNIDLACERVSIFSNHSTGHFSSSFGQQRMIGCTPAFFLVRSLGFVPSQLRLSR